MKNESTSTSLPITKIALIALGAAMLGSFVTFGVVHLSMAKYMRSENKVGYWKDGEMSPKKMRHMGSAEDTQNTESHSFEMTSTLASSSSENFDRDFLELMIVHHQDALDMAELVKQRSTNPELVKFADGIITAQAAEITQMQTWLDAMPEAEVSPESGSMMMDDMQMEESGSY